LGSGVVREVHHELESDGHVRSAYFDSVMLRQLGMTKHVAFLRAINVGTTNRITMVKLSALIESAGCSNVSSYLQSGNMIFEGVGKSDEIVSRIEAELVAAGLKKADVILRTTRELSALIKQDPFASYDAKTHKFSVSFLKVAPVATPMERLAKDGVEVCLLDDRTLCLAVPHYAALSGGASTVIDKTWGTPSTTRWWNVVEAVTERACSRRGEKLQN
jgi:uncharacterized protein (DUF1697 family)